MKGLIIGAVMIGAMAGQLAAQTYSSGTVVALPLDAAVPALVNPNVSWWGYPSRSWRTGRHGDRGFAESGYAYDPFYDRDDYPLYPGVIVVVLIPQVGPSATPTQPTQPPPPPPAPPLIQSELHEYHWPSSGNDSKATTFSIVSKDGRVQSAAAVWVQDQTLHYVAPDGSQGQMPIDSIDREGTRQRNARNQVSFCLPAPNTAPLQVQLSLASGRR